MKFALIALGLLATTGVVYAACVFCWQKCSRDEKARLSAGPFCLPPSDWLATGQNGSRNRHLTAGANSRCDLRRPGGDQRLHLTAML